MEFFMNSLQMIDHKMYLFPFMIYFWWHQTVFLMEPQQMTGNIQIKNPTRD